MLSFHMSHIKAKRMGGDFLDNVETLCGDCHRKYHNYGPSMEKPVPAKERA
jgi:5-methylcytosine-specific restriction endonuclease McrA